MYSYYGEEQVKYTIDTTDSVAYKITKEVMGNSISNFNLYDWLIDNYKGFRYHEHLPGTLYPIHTQTIQSDIVYIIKTTDDKGIVKYSVNLLAYSYADEPMYRGTITDEKLIRLIDTIMLCYVGVSEKVAQAIKELQSNE